MSPPSPAAQAETAAGGKSARILDAAQTLFWRYGLRRTSIDDVAQEAGIAKGTVYLYFDGKETLFSAVAQRVCEGVLAEIEAVRTSDRPFTEKLARLLDAKIGSIKRLLSESPHAAELMDESRSRHGRPAFEAMDAGFQSALAATIAAAMSECVINPARAGLDARGVGQAVIEAAYGALQTGPLEQAAYLGRLKRHLDLLASALAPAS